MKAVRVQFIGRDDVGPFAGGNAEVAFLADGCVNDNLAFQCSCVTPVGDYR
jgi:hypothetical protein